MASLASNRSHVKREETQEGLLVLVLVLIQILALVLVLVLVLVLILVLILVLVLVLVIVIVLALVLVLILVGSYPFQIPHPTPIQETLHAMAHVKHLEDKLDPAVYLLANVVLRPAPVLVPAHERPCRVLVTQRDSDGNPTRYRVLGIPRICQ